MRGRLFEKRRWLFAIGGVLCLLAACFAFEAKLACYSPASSPAAQISATKLQSADAPKLIAKVLSAPSVQYHLPAEPIFVLSVAPLGASAMLSTAESVHDQLKPQAFSNFSPHLFRRPPPQS
jgi:hypothetical protein